MSPRLSALVVSGFFGIAAPTRAQQPPPRPSPGPYARVVVLAPKPGQQAAFEAGYVRHLEWHRRQRDPWVWYGWSFVLGERAGLFMDGTFGHAAADFDAAVQPAADAADNAANVFPYADVASHALYERLDALSVGAELPDTSPYLALATYRVRPGQAPAFEALLALYRAHWQQSAQRDPGARGARYAWFRLRIGGQAPQFLLVRGVASWSEAATLSHFFEAARVERPSGAPPLSEMVEGIRTELLQYRREMSYAP